eukprot:CAMPEP_0196581458 /NCGR_PEP_ID=MMETSP1081-20130531/33972_1 /TAXON_ID=36882 /ORGANISM="Pyramimonas amylifera, Strain CCMP720" /LENGTH=378 /DNA_ID=CAMNT_0041901695 /DNA_START=130 /DNA_END=1266 /DNA_ORIENTATION=+
MGFQQRDGDWECCLCDNFNFSTRDFCNQCSEPRKLVDKANPVSQGGPVRQGDWICGPCSNRNFGSRNSCKKCNADRSLADLKLNAPPAKHANQGGRNIQGPYHGGPPSNYGGQPSNYGGQPSNYGGQPSNYGGQPSNYGGQSSNYGGQPPNYGGQLSNYGGQPHNDYARSGGYGSPVGGIGPSNYPQMPSNIMEMQAQMLSSMMPPGIPQYSALQHFSQLAGGVSNAPVSMGGGGMGSDMSGGWGNDARGGGGHGGGYMGGGAARPGREVREGDWICTECQNDNFAFRTHCKRCEAPKADLTPEQLQAAKEASAMRTQDVVRPGDWICHSCKNNNFAWRDQCKRCLAPKQATGPSPLKGKRGGVDGDSGYNSKAARIE